MSTKMQWKQEQRQYMTVVCPTCGAEVDNYCVTTDFSKRGPGRLVGAHINRKALALKLKYGLVEP